MRKLLILMLAISVVGHSWAEEVSANELATQVRSNIVGFRKHYAGKVFDVTARFGRLHELGRLYVISLSYEDALSLSVYIECHLARGRESDAADLKTGDEIKVSGKIKYKRSEIFGRDAIQISGCTIVK